MGFFGRLGIDGRLLLAQAINFGLLVWLLNRYVYKPLLKGMESSELERAEREMAKIKAEKEAFARERAELSSKDKKRAADMISEAENVASDLNARIKDEAQEEKEKLLSLFRDRVAAQEASLAAALPREAKKAIVERLASTWEARFKDGKAARAQQYGYLDDLAKDVAALKADRLDPKDGDVILMGALEPDDEESRTVADALKKKLKRDGISVRTKADPALLAGYRLEVSGVVIDRNLRADITDAIEGS